VNVLGHISGAALIVAAFAFHFRARFLGDQALGWPAAPVVVRRTIDGVSGVLTASGFWWASTGHLPDLVLAAVTLAVAVYAVVLAWNVGRQRQASD